MTSIPERNVEISNYTDHDNYGDNSNSDDGVDY